MLKDYFQFIFFVYKCIQPIWGEYWRDESRWSGNKLVPSGTSHAEGVPIPSVQEGATLVEMECQGCETCPPYIELAIPRDFVGGIMRIVPSDANVSNCLKIVIMY